MGESSKFPNSWFLENQTLELAVCSSKILTLCPCSSLQSRLLITFANSLDPDQTRHFLSGLIKTQTVWHYDGVPERIFEKGDFDKQECPWALGHSPENDWSVEWNHLWNLSRVHQEEQFCGIILNWGQWFRKRCCLKDFLSGALAVLLFGAVEPFMQFWKRASWRIFMWSYMEFGPVVQKKMLIDVYLVKSTHTYIYNSKLKHIAN